MKPLVGVLLLLLALVAAAAAAGDPAAQAEAPPDELVVALAMPAEGFQVGAVRNGDVVLARGFEVDLARSVARSLGRDVRFVQRSRGSLTAPGVKAWDLALAQLSASGGGQSGVELSIPYLPEDLAVVLRKGGRVPARPRDLGRLQLCATAGSVGAKAVAKLTQRTAPIVPGSDARLVELVATGRCDAAFVDGTRVGLLLEGVRGRVSRVGLRLVRNGGLVIALPRGSALLPSVDTAVARLIRNGTVHRLAVRWLGLDPWRLRALCAVSHGYDPRCRDLPALRRSASGAASLLG